MKDLLKNALLDQKEIFGDELFSPPIEISMKKKKEKKEYVAKSEPVFISEPTFEFENINTLDELYEEIHTCQRCPLGKTRTKFVFGKGNPNADLMLIGEAPGADEDKTGEPFVGRAGKLLTDILKAINFSRDEVYIANILKCRPPNNRDPLPSERETCMPYLMKQIELIKPKIILCLGRIAATTLLGTKLSLTKMRGEVYDFRGIKLMVTYHPAALLRNPQWKRPVWEDVQKLRKLYEEIVENG